MESRTTLILGGDDEDIAKMESRTTPIREGEDDEDITTLDTPTPWSSPSCNSFPTQLPRRSRIQQTRRHCFGHNSLIRHRNGPFLDALEGKGTTTPSFWIWSQLQKVRGSFCVTTARCCIRHDTWPSWPKIGDAAPCRGHIE